MIKNINTELLKAALVCAGNTENRYHLEGLFIEPHKDGGLTYTSTNGHILCSAYDKEAEHRLKSPICIKIKPSLLNLIQDDTVSIDVKKNHIIGSQLGIKVKTIEPEGYPNYRKAVSKVKKEGSCDTYNQKYIRNFMSVPGIFGLKNPSILIKSCKTGTPAIVRFAGIDDWFGVIMPTISGCEDVVPEWFEGQ